MAGGVIGRCGDMLGVWMAPVTAQVTMTVRLMALTIPPLDAGVIDR
jgi:hypothetical protein